MSIIRPMGIRCQRAEARGKRFPRPWQVIQRKLKKLLQKEKTSKDKIMKQKTTRSTSLRKYVKRNNLDELDGKMCTVLIGQRSVSPRKGNGTNTL